MADEPTWDDLFGEPLTPQPPQQPVQQPPAQQPAQAQQPAAQPPYTPPLVQPSAPSTPVQLTPSVPAPNAAPPLQDGESLDLTDLYVKLGTPKLFTAGCLFGIL